MAHGAMAHAGSRHFVMQNVAPPYPRHPQTGAAPQVLVPGYSQQQLPTLSGLPQQPHSGFPQPSPQVYVAAPVEQPKEQESDLMERLPQGPSMCDELTTAVRLVSLGCYCGPKLSFQKMGRGSETLPFDWIRTKLDGVLKLLRSDFDGFYSFTTAIPVPGCTGMTCFRGPLHSFWHDNPTEPSMVEKYTRRIARFKEINAQTEPVLFVRVASQSDELPRAPELLREVERFGPCAKLLMILNFQEACEGPCLVWNYDNLMLYFLPPTAHSRSGGTFNQPYVKPVLNALDWVVGRQVPKLKQFPNLQAAQQVLTHNTWGKFGLGNLWAFEDGQA